MRDPFFEKENCDRCGGKLHVRIMSKFNKDTLCTDCKCDERDAPGYAAADATEVAAVKRREYNFPGVGLSSADLAFLEARRRQRETV